MMTKEQITLAVKQAKYVQEEYPEFWQFHEMLMNLNQNLDEVNKIQEIVKLTNG